jgi:hypothetical protein
MTTARNNQYRTYSWETNNSFSNFVLFSTTPAPKQLAWQLTEPPNQHLQP